MNYATWMFGEVLVRRSLVHTTNTTLTLTGLHGSPGEDVLFKIRSADVISERLDYKLISLK